MIKKILFGILGLGLAISAQAEDLPMPGYYSIQEIPRTSAGSTYTTEGYVVFQYQCPPCPPPDQCKPCMESNIIISENNVIRRNYSDLSDTELLVFTDNAEKLELGKRYYFVVSIKAIPYSPAQTRVELGQWWEVDQSAPDIGPGGVSD
ncbi:MAG: hypothetical protein Q8Q08_05270 [Candidatus Omnitrophota bacterium]|nr:hypothetical protein [Candidatus Omnitrophota bacterium]